MTCPLMQLALVLMGGSRIPEYRRMVMPGLFLALNLWHNLVGHRQGYQNSRSVIVLCCGTASMLLFDIWVTWININSVSAAVFFFFFFPCTTNSEVYVAYGVGLCFAAIMFWLNRQQIVEHSDGQECLLCLGRPLGLVAIFLMNSWAILELRVRSF